MTRVRETTGNDEVADVAVRLRPYLDAQHTRGGSAPGPDPGHGSPLLDDLVERAATLVTVMPPRQRRETIEELVCPNDVERGRRAVAALIERGLVAEDERRCLSLLHPAG